MTDLNLQLTREFFELNYYRVLTPWQRPGAADGAQLYVEKNIADSGEPPPPILTVASLSEIPRAIVEVRPWHSERFYASAVDASPVLYQFARDASYAAASDFFGGQDFRSILVVSELPTTAKARNEALAALQRNGVQHALEFPTILRDLLDRINSAGDYAGSATLQLLQLIKRYRLARNNQMEFTFPMEPPIPSQGPPVDVAQDD